MGIEWVGNGYGDENKIKWISEFYLIWWGKLMVNGYLFWELCLELFELSKEDLFLMEILIFD